jgi:signal peptidase I
MGIEFAVHGVMFSGIRSNSVNGRVLALSRDLAFCARKVLRYRRHLIPTGAIVEIESLTESVRESVGTKDYQSLGRKNEKLRDTLSKHGGDIFPAKFLNDHTEVLFVASLLAIAIRTFFVQSFQIPTNSMFPTYHGMTHRLVRGEKTDKNFLRIAFDTVILGKREICAIADSSGEISIPLVKQNGAAGDYIVPYEIIFEKKFGGLTSKKARKYTLFVGSNQLQITIPVDFSLDSVLLEKFCPNFCSWKDFVSKTHHSLVPSGNVSFLKTGHFVDAGRPILHFEILPGDMLFVDKITYNFRHPRVGECVIFITDKIDAFANSPKFFIKRLVGKPGDTLAIRDSKLFANGDALFACSTIDKLNSKADGYANGYVAAGTLDGGSEISVPNGKYFMLGDNSANSYDSRFWGFVQQKSVIGRPLIVFFPLNSRFGIHR